MVVIKNGRVMDPKTGLDQVCDLRIEGKKIVEIAENLPTDGQEVLDATGLVGCSWFDRCTRAFPRTRSNS